MSGLYIKETFIFNGKKYGVLKSESDENFEMFVKITRVNAKYTDWISINDTMASIVKNHYKKLKKERDS